MRQSSDEEWYGESEPEEGDGVGPHHGSKGGGGGGDHQMGSYYGGRNDRNERHGRGRAELPGGDLYLGCYFRGKRHGLGVYRYKKGGGARYGGDWYLGVKQGWGTMFYPDGGQYTGNWDKGQMHGWGVYVYPNGDEYEGFWYQGHKNGQGIYRVEATGEKFVGTWVLGHRQGKGMLIRKEFKFLGNWWNDAPKGPGVYILPDLGVEQHGTYTILKLKDESVETYKGTGYQILKIRKDPPPPDPVEKEKEVRDQVGGSAEGPKKSQDGEGEGEESSQPKKKVDVLEKTPEQLLEDKVAKQMGEWIEQELGNEEKNQVYVTPIWRVTNVTGLMTELMDETVPPPPIPATPLPLEEEGEEKELAPSKVEESGPPCKEDENEEAYSLFLSRHHVVGDPYTGSGTCQYTLAQINWPDDCPPAVRSSEMSFSTLEDLKNVVQSVLDKPLEPLDFEKIVAQNLHLFKKQAKDGGKGGGGTLDEDEKWLEYLLGIEKCGKTAKKCQEGGSGLNAEVEEMQKRMSVLNEQGQPRTSEGGRGAISLEGDQEGEPMASGPLGEEGEGRGSSGPKTPRASEEAGPQEQEEEEGQGGRKSSGVQQGDEEPAEPQE